MDVTSQFVKAAERTGFLLVELVNYLGWTQYLHDLDDTLIYVGRVMLVLKVAATATMELAVPISVSERSCRLGRPRKSTNKDRPIVYKYRGAYSPDRVAFGLSHN